MYVFPGIGLGAILAQAVSITQDMIYASAESLSTSLNKQEVADGWLYPDIRRIREVSVVVTRGVIRAAQKNGVDRATDLRDLSDEQLDSFIKERMYNPFNELESQNGHSNDVDAVTNGVAHL
jgi:malate dehydrogenase (oxaloacetate-decarboxylating)(NADP+)